MTIIKQNKQGAPLIGIGVSRAKRGFQRLVEERLEQYPDDITLIRFHIKDLDFENLQVKGDYFEKRGGRINQKKGVFPFPDAIYLQCHVKHKTVRKIEQLIGRKVFNSFIFDKWECWDLLKKDNELRNHLPYTQKLEHLVILQHLLYSYEDIFLKPIDPTHGHSSRAIFRVKLQEEGKIETIYQEEKKIQREQFTSPKKFLDWISPKFSTKAYIIQQSIQTVKYEEMATDIRLHMNKNGKGEWEVSTLIFRVATNSSHISNGISILGINYLEEMTDSTIKRAIVNLGSKICSVLDQSGYHMGDLGIDLGVDKNGHVWIFEVNPLPYPYTLFQYHAFTKPIEYAHYLATNSKR